MPFITEELWGSIADRNNMLVHEDWPTYKSEEVQDLTADRELELVII